MRKHSLLTRLCHNDDALPGVQTIRLQLFFTHCRSCPNNDIPHLLLELFFLSSPFLCPELPFSSLSSPSLLFLTAPSLPSLSRSRFFSFFDDVSFSSFPSFSFRSFSLFAFSFFSSLSSLGGLSLDLSSPPPLLRFGSRSL